MTKRWSIGLSGLLLVALSVSFNCGENPSSVDFLQKAREINRRITLLDSHVDIPLDYATEAVDPGVLNDSLRVDLVKMAQGGVNGVFLAAYVPQDTCNASGYERGRKIAGTRIEAIHRLCETMYPDRIELARSTEDVSRIAGQGKQVAVIGMENGYPIGKDLSMLDHYYGLGVRYITLCHNGHNDICDSANPPNEPWPENVSYDDPGVELLKAVGLIESLYSPEVTPEHGGLSRFGRQVVERMNRLGMMIDLSHAGESTFWDVIELSEAPVIASHSSCRALCDMTRNLNDEQLKALKKNGGCVQITPVSMFISLSAGQREAMKEALDKIGMLAVGYMEVLKIYSEEPALYDRIQAAYLEEVEEINRRFPQPDVTDFVDHIDHAVKLIGIDHVGIGSDFDGGGGVEGFRNAAEAVNVTAELLRRGYSEKQIARLWGGNILRVWREVEQKASALQADTDNL